MNQKITNLINKLKDKKIHIVGLSSTEGASITLFLCKNGINPENLTIHDFLNSYEEFEKSFNINHVGLSKIERNDKINTIKKLNLKIRFKKDYLNGINDANIIFVTQNWFNYSCNFPYLKEAFDKNIPFINITELYFTLAPCSIVGITGSCGKTTTSNLIYEILKKVRYQGLGGKGEIQKNGIKKVFFTGNDRYAKQILEDIDIVSSDDILVMEISNRQLINLKYSPHIAVITNILPNHIDEHGSFENYIKVKFNLFASQNKSDFAVINYDNMLCRDFIPQIKSRVFPFSRKMDFNDNGVYEKEGEIFAVREGKVEKICEVEEIPLHGEHNIENVLAAIGAGFLAGADQIQIVEGIRNFKGVKNRLELIRKINNISYYNDLSSTTPSATSAALRALHNNIILIAGGHDKGMDYKELAQEIKTRVKKLILLHGRGTEKIIQALESAQESGVRSQELFKKEIYEQSIKRKGQGYGFVTVNSIEEAVNMANMDAHEGDKVILSPACANFYSLYVKDKNGFNKLVKKI